MPRYIYPAGTVGSAGGALRVLRFYRTATANRPLTDLTNVSGGVDTSTIPNGVIVTDTTGAYPSFCGPDDITSLWYELNDAFGRTQISTTTPVSYGTPATNYGATPTVEPDSGAGTSATAVASGNGQFSTITVTTGTATAADALCVVTLPAAPTATETIVVAPKTSAAARANLYVYSVADAVVTVAAATTPGQHSQLAFDLYSVTAV